MSVHTGALRAGMMKLLVHKVRNHETLTMQIGHPMAVVNQLIDANNRAVTNSAEVSGLVVTLYEEVLDLRARIEQLENRG